MKQQVDELLEAILAQSETEIGASAAIDDAFVRNVRTRYEHARRLQQVAGTAAHYDEQLAYATLALAFALSAQAYALLAQVPGWCASGTDSSPMGQARTNVTLAIVRFDATSAKFLTAQLNAFCMPVICYLESQARSALLWAQASKALLDAAKFDSGTLQPAVEAMRHAAHR